MATLPVRMDIRGFLRFQEGVTKALKLSKTPYADIYIDSKGKRIAIVPSKTLKETSFRFISSNTGYLLYLKGVMNRVAFKVVSGPTILTVEGKKLIFTQKKTRKTGVWELVACRNSVGLPMISLDRRGTLILDKRTSTQLETTINNTLSAEYNSSKKKFSLTFGKKGFINVRTISSHANASFMGTLSSFGIPLPEKRFRTHCNIEDHVLTFNASKLVSKKK